MDYYLNVLGVWLIGMLAGGVLIFAGQRLFRRISPAIRNSEIASKSIEDWAVLATGRSGWIEIEYSWLRKAQEVYGVFCKKQADYGPTNIGVGGTQGITVRLGDKISRLFELLGLTQRENPGKPANESVRDTMVDIGDYGIIGMIVLDGEWPLVDPAEVWGGASLVDFILVYAKENPEFYEELLVRMSEWRVAEAIAEDLGGEVTDV
jgi:hypothetical protein